MSPSAATAQDAAEALGATVRDPRLAEQIRALMVGGAEASGRRTARRRVGDDSPRTPMAQHTALGQRQATALIATNGGQLPGSPAEAPVKNTMEPLRLRPLQLERPGRYRN